MGTSTSYGLLEYFIVFVSKDNLGADGAKTIYATATEVALAESDPSTEYAFTLDTVAPEMVKVFAEIEGKARITCDPVAVTVTVTFNEAVDIDEDILDIWEVGDLAEFFFRATVSTVELISPKVVELEVVFEFPSPTYEPEVGDVIRVSCDTIEDLAGNKATSVAVA
ncbi:hypothetical protein ES708_34445 [subsurface metagenome]